MNIVVALLPVCLAVMLCGLRYPTLAVVGFAAVCVLVVATYPFASRTTDEDALVGQSTTLPPPAPAIPPPAPAIPPPPTHSERVAQSMLLLGKSNDVSRRAGAALDGLHRQMRLDNVRDDPNTVTILPSSMVTANNTRADIDLWSSTII
jgi:hypothetical protein